MTIVGIGMKMYLGHAASLTYLRGLAQTDARGASVFVLPSFPTLAAAREVLAGSAVGFGAQDGHWEDAGPYTGSVSAAMLAELGCTYMEVGHAERRRDFAEDDAMTARKARAAARHGLTPIVCVGETSADQDPVAAVTRQLASLGEHPLIVAYEPAWAIGGEKPARPDRVARVVAAVRERWNAPILYGGSVTPSETRGLLATGIDGIFASRSLLVPGGLDRMLDAIAPPPTAASPSRGPSPAG